MYSYQKQLLPKNTVEITVDIPKTDIQSEYSLAFAQLHKDLAIKGFRKGKVPKELAKKHITDEAVYQQLIKSLIPKIYDELLKKESLRPISNPKIELLKAKAGTDWKIKITIALQPTITLGDYKNKISQLKLSSKKADIWVPGKKDQPQENQEKQRQSQLNEILNLLLSSIKCEISDYLLEEELNRRLAQLMDDIRKIGLTVENYLKLKNISLEELKKNYLREIEDTYRLEFILQAIADQEGIKVEQADIDKLLAAIKDEKERKLASDNAYFYAAILRKQKTLDFLLNL